MIIKIYILTIFLLLDFVKLFHFQSTALEAELARAITLCRQFKIK
jgi:hypothetical protein